MSERADERRETRSDSWTEASSKEILIAIAIAVPFIVIARFAIDILIGGLFDAYNFHLVTAAATVVFLTIILAVPKVILTRPSGRLVVVTVVCYVLAGVLMFGFIVLDWNLPHTWIRD